MAKNYICVDFWHPCLVSPIKGYLNGYLRLPETRVCQQVSRCSFTEVPWGQLGACRPDWPTFATGLLQNAGYLGGSTSMVQHISCDAPVLRPIPRFGWWTSPPPILRAQSRLVELAPQGADFLAPPLKKLLLVGTGLLVLG